MATDENTAWRQKGMCSTKNYCCQNTCPYCKGEAEWVKYNMLRNTANKASQYGGFYCSVYMLKPHLRQEGNYSFFMKLDFQPITLDMKPLVESYTKAWKLKNSEYTFTNLFMWGKSENIRIAEHNNALYISLQDDESSQPLMFAPLTRDIDGDYAAALDVATQYFHSIGVTPLYKAICGPIKEAFAKCEGYTLTEDRDNHDYIYCAQSLLTLSGKKLHSKRNHINQFRAQYVDSYHYLPLRPEMLDECLALFCEWLENKDLSTPGIINEMDAIRRIITHMDALNVVGGGICIGGKLAAFTLGEKIDDEMALIHIEKADSSIMGLFTFINQQFVEHEFAQMQCINREEDMGLEGLRRAKLSYNPTMLLEKFEGRVRE